MPGHTYVEPLEVMTQKLTERPMTVNPASQVARRADAAMLMLAHLDFEDSTRLLTRRAGRGSAVEQVEQLVLVDYIPTNTPVEA